MIQIPPDFKYTPGLCCQQRDLACCAPVGHVWHIFPSLESELQSTLSVSVASSMNFDELCGVQDPNSPSYGTKDVRSPVNPCIALTLMAWSSISIMAPYSFFVTVCITYASLSSFTVRGRPHPRWAPLGGAVLQPVAPVLAARAIPLIDNF